MANLGYVEKIKLEKLFEMDSGYVLDFSNRSFQEFVLNVCNIDIYSNKYDYNSGSKANRLRAFFNLESNQTVGKLLVEMLDYWNAQKLLSDTAIKNNEKTLFDNCLQIANNLQGNKQTKKISKTDFLKREFNETSLSSLKLEGPLVTIVKQRLEEIDKCLDAKVPLAAIFLAGSTLEGLLLGTAANNAKKFNQNKSCPKDKSGKPKKFTEWTLSDLINISCNLGLIGEDVKEFSHALRNFRNYIHPHQQASTGFMPDIQTAEISVKVLKAAIEDLSTY